MSSARDHFKSIHFVFVDITFCLLFLCSCATRNSNHSQLPADVTMNKDAVRNGWLIITLRLQDGEKLPMLVDTGCPVTLFEKSVESKLGKRLDTGTFHNFGAIQKMGVYAAPKLYLGNVPLEKTGTNVFTYDHTKLVDGKTNRHLFFKGMLGMDILGHYCIQLDFTAGKMRFLDDEHANKRNWGELFPLTNLGDGFGDGCVAINENLTGIKDSKSEIDTGCNYGGWLTPKLFQQWTNQISSPSKGEMRSPSGVLGGEIYHELDLHGTEEKSVLKNDAGFEFNGIGMQVLLQNLVTLDFPNRTMYLKRTSKWPLLDKDAKAKMTVAEKSIFKFFHGLKSEGRLPGWSKGETTTFDGAFHFQPPDSATFEGEKRDDPSSIYHYIIIRTSQDSPWKLQKAWRTDSTGKVLEEYPIP